jgi:hypothetical protein
MHRPVQLAYHARPQYMMSGYGPTDPYPSSGQVSSIPGAAGTHNTHTHLMQHHEQTLHLGHRHTCPTLLETGRDAPVPDPGMT